MTLGELLARAYAWALTHREWILLAAVLLPVVGTVLARIGKAGKTDAEGRYIASVVVGVGLSAVIVEMLALVVARSALHRSLLEADVLLLVAPLVCLAGCLIGIRWVFPLSELASVRTFLDAGAFVLACLAVLWLFSKFRGWGFLFFGSIAELVAIVVFGYALLRRLYRRAFGTGGRPAPG